MKRNLRTKKNPAKCPKLTNKPSTSEAHNDKESKLMLLNDDCLREVLNYLTLKDLCSVSQTCKLLKELTAERFNVRFPREAKVVKDLENGKMMQFKCLAGVYDYVKCFGRIRNVHLKNAAAFEKLKELYKDKIIDFRIDGIRFDSWNNISKQSLNFECSLKTLFIANKHLRMNECILQNSPTLERLTLWKNLDYDNNVQQVWSLDTYPKLKYFAWHLDKEMDVGNMKILFEHNKQIEEFSLLSSNIDTINQCVANDMNITELFFKVTSNVETNHVGLKDFLGKDTSKRLHLSFADSSRADLSENLELLKRLSPNIYGLYFERTIINQELANVIGKMNKLTVLQASDMLENLVDLPILEKYYCSRFVISDRDDRINESMLLFASRSLKLKKMFFRNDSQPFNTFRFNEFNERRNELVSAEKLSIYIKTVKRNGTGGLSEIKLNYDTLNIFEVELDDVKNPLVNEYTYSKRICSTCYNYDNRLYW